MSRRWPIALLTFAVVGIALQFVSEPYTVRFAFAPANYWVAAASCVALPLGIAWLGARAMSKAVRVGVLVAATLLALPFGGYALLVLISAPQGTEDLSLLPLGEASVPQAHYRLYQTNCGATCAFGLELRRELDIPGGLRIVSPVWSAHREEPAAVRFTEQGTVEVYRGGHVLVSLKP